MTAQHGIAFISSEDMSSEVTCTKKLPTTTERGTQTILQLNPADLLVQDNNDYNTSKVDFAVDHHPGMLSSDWDYKDRRQILEEKRTFFNNFLVIERIYESDEKEKHDDGDCESCNSSKESETKESSTKSDETKAVEEAIVVKRESIPGIRVHRPSFCIPAMYKVDIKELQERLDSSRGWCRYVLGGFVCMAMFAMFALAFLGIEHMED